MLEGNFLCPDVEQCAKMLVERCPNLEVYITFNFRIFHAHRSL